MRWNSRSHCAGNHDHHGAERAQIAAKQAIKEFLRLSAFTVIPRSLPSMPPPVPVHQAFLILLEKLFRLYYSSIGTASEK
jgi:hypothetical protein